MEMVFMEGERINIIVDIVELSCTQTAGVI